jgi:hypothetical protein
MHEAAGVADARPAEHARDHAEVRATESSSLDLDQLVARLAEMEVGIAAREANLALRSLHSAERRVFRSRMA